MKRKMIRFGGTLIILLSLLVSPGCGGGSSSSTNTSQDTGLSGSGK